MLVLAVVAILVAFLAELRVTITVGAVIVGAEFEVEVLVVVGRGMEGSGNRVLATALAFSFPPAGLIVE